MANLRLFCLCSCFKPPIKYRECWIIAGGSRRTFFTICLQYKVVILICGYAKMCNRKYPPSCDYRTGDQSCCRSLSVYSRVATPLAKKSAEN